MTLDASVVVPTRDKRRRLRATLACLAGQCARGSWEVVVVDDGSRDGTDAVLEEAAGALPLRVVVSGGRGRAAARNLGAAHATGRRLVFLDDDILVGDDFIARHLLAADAARTSAVHGALLEMPAAERWLDAVAGCDGAGIRAMRPSGAGSGPFRLVANALERAVQAMHDGRLPAAVPWLGCVGANLGVNRDVFLHAGGFDEAFGLAWGCEDLELGVRLCAAGTTVALVPDARGVHLSHPRPGRWDEHAGNMERLRALHPGDPGILALRVLLGPEGDPRAYVAEVVAKTRSASGRPHSSG